MKIQGVVFWVVLQMEATGSSETSVFYRHTTERHNQADLDLCARACVQLLLVQIPNTFCLSKMTSKCLPAIMTVTIGI